MNLKILNAEDLNKLYPSSFEIPSKEEKNTIMSGDFVKLIFTDNSGDSNERMWVKITKIKRRKILGRLDNQPFLSKEIGVQLNDKIKFKKENIIDIYERNENRDQFKKSFS